MTEVFYMKKQILIAYYAHSTNTQKIANLIHKEVGGTLHEILPETPYPRSYNAVVDQAKKEIQAGYKTCITINPRSY